MKAAPPPTGKPRGVTRERIVEVSRAIVENEGVAQLTIRRIAETAGRTQPAVYQHFSSKDAIIAELATEGFVDLAERMTQAARSKNAVLAAVMRAYVRFGSERPRIYEIMFEGPPAIAFAAGDTTPPAARAAFGILLDAIACRQPEKPSAETFTEVVWAALHGLVMLTMTGRVRASETLAKARLKQLTAIVASDAASADG